METHVVESLTASAPVPVVAGATFAPEDDHSWILVEGAGSFTKTLEELVGHDYTGCGTLLLTGIKLNTMCSASGDTIKAGFKTAVNTSLSLNVAALKPNGYIFKANSYNYGAAQERIMIPDNTMSMQIRPIPSDRPVLQFMFSQTAGVTTLIDVAVKVVGPRHHYSTLNW